MLEKLNINKKNVVCIIFLIGLCSYFFLESRYPKLNEKASMGPKNQIANLINYEVLLPIQKESSFIQRVLKGSVNWYYTNYKGMLFGLFFAAGILTLFLARKKGIYPKGNFFRQSIMGSLIGAPLGVCVNCSTPIGQGFLSAKFPNILNLSIIMSSPTLNFVVLIMTFSLFPLHFAISKVVLTLIFIWVVIPFLYGLFEGKKENPAYELNNIIPNTKNISWSFAIYDWGKDYLKNLFQIIKLTIPLMLLSGLLGSIMAELVPKSLFTNIVFGPLSLAFTSLVATFLPVPMAFDCVLTFLLFQAGLPIGLSFTLFFCLGVFSIFPFLMIWKNFSIKTALAIAVSVVLTGIIGGIGMDVFGKAILERSKYLLERENNQKNMTELEIAGILHSKIVKLCGDYKPESKQNCVYDNVIRMVSGKANRSLCEFLPKAKEKASCYFSHDYETQNLPFTLDFCLGKENDLIKWRCIDLLYSRMGVHKALESNFCLQLVELEDQKKCFKKLATKISHSVVGDFDAKSLCKTIPDQDTRELCLENYLLKVANDTQDLGVCNQIKTRKAEICRAEILNKTFIESSKKEGKNFCEKQKNDHLRGVCQIELINEMSELGTLRPIFCGQIKDINYRVYCLDKYNFAQCIKSGDGEICNKVHTTSLREESSFRMIHNKAKKTKNILLCNTISSLPLRKECFNDLANDVITIDLAKLNFSIINQLGKTDDHLFDEFSKKEIKIPQSEVTLKTAENVFKKGDLVISYSQFLKKNQGNGKNQFERIEGPLKGISSEEAYFPFSKYQPFEQSASVAAGDLNKDEMADFILPAQGGLRLFFNQGDFQFREVFLPLDTNLYFKPLLVTMVDINNDKNLDIFFSTWKKGSYFLLNQGGFFNPNKMLYIPNTKGRTAMAAAFGDIDKNGFLDVVLGNFTYGYGIYEKGIESSNNQVFFNNGKLLEEVDLGYDVGGETLSALLSDFDNNNQLEIAFANDFDAPDTFHKYLGNKKFVPLYQNKNIETSAHTMSIDTGDVNNDLLADILFMDFDPLGQKGKFVSDYCEEINNELEKNLCLKTISIEKMVKVRNPNSCLKLENNKDRNACLLNIYLLGAIETGDSKYCDFLPKNSTLAKEICISHLASQESSNKAKTEIINLPKQKWKNILSLGGKDGPFSSGKVMELKGAGYAWNAKFSDFDNDGWQDLFVANGFMTTKRIDQKVFFRNLEGKEMKRSPPGWEVNDYIYTFSYSVGDFDLDGDLDIVTPSPFGPTRVFLNNEEKNNSIEFDFIDNKGNFFGVGNKIVIYYGKNKSSRQIREVKLGGGYQSYNPTTLHFGLGDNKFIDGIDIFWSTGEKSEVRRKFVGGKYLIERIKI